MRFTLFILLLIFFVRCSSSLQTGSDVEQYEDVVHLSKKQLAFTVDQLNLLLKTQDYPPHKVKHLNSIYMAFDSILREPNFEPIEIKSKLQKIAKTLINVNPFEHDKIKEYEYLLGSFDFNYQPKLKVILFESSALQLLYTKIVKSNIHFKFFKAATFNRGDSTEVYLVPYLSDKNSCFIKGKYDTIQHKIIEEKENEYTIRNGVYCIKTKGKDEYSGAIKIWSMDSCYQYYLFNTK